MPQKKRVIRNTKKVKVSITPDEFIFRVQKKADELYEKRDYKPGNDLEDRLQAEMKHTF